MAVDGERGKQGTGSPGSGPEVATAAPPPPVRQSKERDVRTVF